MKKGNEKMSEELKIVNFREFNVNNFIKSDKDEISTLEDCEEKRKNKEIFCHQFTFADKRGNLYSYKNDIKIMMKNKEIQGFKYNPLYKGDYLREKHFVIITEIDIENQTVYVSAAKAKEEPRKKLEEAIRNGLQNKAYIRTKAIVVALVGDDSVALVDLGGVGLLGSIKLSQWSTSYTVKFTNKVKKGDVIEVVILGEIIGKKGTIYECSRKLTIEFDPWQAIEKKLPKNTSVIVKCTDKTVKNFFGTIEGIPELNAYCEYPDSSDIVIVEGEYYAGYVSKVNEESKLLRVRILDYVKEH